MISDANLESIASVKQDKIVKAGLVENQIEYWLQLERTNSHLISSPILLRLRREG